MANGNAKIEAEAAVKRYAETQGRVLTEEEKFAYLMGWYDGRIALLDQRTTDEQTAINRILKEMGVDNE